MIRDLCAFASPWRLSEKTGSKLFSRKDAKDSQRRKGMKEARPDADSGLSLRLYPGPCGAAVTVPDGQFARPGPAQVRFRGETTHEIARLPHLGIPGLYHCRPDEWNSVDEDNDLCRESRSVQRDAVRTDLRWAREHGPRDSRRFLGLVRRASLTGRITRRDTEETSSRGCRHADGSLRGPDRGEEIRGRDRDFRHTRAIDVVPDERGVSATRRCSAGRSGCSRFSTARCTS